METRSGHSRRRSIALGRTGAPGREPRLRRAGLAVLAALALGAGPVALTVGAGPAAADVAPTAPVDTPGPALSVPDATLERALKCTAGVTDAARTPVLLVPATGVTPEQNYSWNQEPALAARGIPTCTIELPDHALGDVQTAGEYVTYAIREVHRRAGRKIAIIGHSQGGMVFRWALRWWPDTRAMVDDAIGFAGSNHGTTVIDALPTCATMGCPAASLQQSSKSRFIAALNSRQETFPGISYTNIRTRLDEVVTPSGDEPASSSLNGGGGAITNVAVQDVCPTDLSEHLLVGTVSNTAYELALDALDHPGPADPARARAAACARPLMPGVNPANLQGTIAALSAVPGLVSVTGVNLVGVPLLREEPALKCYVTASCPGQGAAGSDVDAANASRPAEKARLRLSPGRIRAGRATRVTVRTTTSAGRVLSRERVRVLGRSVLTDRRGRATVRVRPKRAGSFVARATGNGLGAATARVRVLRAR